MTQQSPIEIFLTRTWLSRGLAAWLLWPISLVFGAIIAIRRCLFKVGVFEQTRLPVPVIVVGNIYVGGTGKTPLVIWLSRQLREQGFVPGVISRGYGGDASRVVEINAQMSPDDIGDEPLLILQRAGVPLVVGRNRVSAARALLTAHPEVNVIISDDGLQHYALGRDIEILLFDERGIGNGWLLPAGPLREPVTRRFDFRVLNGLESVGENSFSMQLVGQHAEQLINRANTKALKELPENLSIAAAAGIGNPERFFTMLKQLGVNVQEHIALPDHFDYSSNPFESLKVDIILITEKDAVKCSRRNGLADDPRLWVVPVEAAIAGPFSEHLVEKLRGYPTA
ncbi:MAG: tetraacyldisaccharide 4'-kinase [Burkholderiaceae bacterium]